MPVPQLCLLRISCPMQREHLEELVWVAHEPSPCLPVSFLCLQPIPWPGSMVLRGTSLKWLGGAQAAHAAVFMGASWSGRWGSRAMGRTASPGR